MTWAKTGDHTVFANLFCCWVAKLYPALLWLHGLQPARLLCPRDSPRQEYWTGLPFLPPGSSQPRDWTHISCIGRRILHHWATKEALSIKWVLLINLGGKSEIHFGLEAIFLGKTEVWGKVLNGANAQEDQLGEEKGNTRMCRIRHSSWNKISFRQMLWVGHFHSMD